MTHSKAQAMARRLMATAPCDWERTVDRLTMEERAQVWRILDGMALQAVQVGAYLLWRNALGCDGGHAAGIKHANRKGQELWCKLLTYQGYTDING